MNLIEKAPTVTNKPITKIIYQLDFKLEQFTQELDVVPRRIKNRKAASLTEIPSEVWETRKFDDLPFRYYNAVYNTIDMHKGLHPSKVTSELPRTTEV